MSDQEDASALATRRSLSPLPEEHGGTQLGQAAAAADRRDVAGDDDDSDLSDLDEEVFQNYNEAEIGHEVIPIDEDTVVALGKHKKAGRASGAGDSASKGKRRRRDRGARQDDDEQQPTEVHIELTEEESMLRPARSCARVRVFR